MKLLSICGSRSETGQTARAAEAVLGGAAAAGATVERIFLPQLALEHCRQCEDNGWGTCRSQGRCCVEDSFPDILEKIGAADVVLFSTPVYYSDLSESLRALTDRLRRTSSHEDGKARLRGKAVMGVCVAGGGGGGAPACCVSLEKVLNTCGFDVKDMAPVRRQNLDDKLRRLELAGEWLVKEAEKTHRQE